jgi:hypothetical protein
MHDQTDKLDSIAITGDGNVIGDGSSSRVQKGGIHAGRIEADNVVDGVQVQGGTPARAAALVEAAKAIQRGGITADEIKAGNVVSGLQFLTGKPPEDQADLRAEVAALHAQVQQAVDDGEVADAGDAEDVTDALAKTEAELAKPEPNGKRAARKLEEAAEILTGAAEAAAAAGKLGRAVVKLAPLAMMVWKMAEALL